MIKYLKRLFGIKPTEAKIEVAPVQEVIVAPTPEVVPEPVVVAEVVPEPVPEPVVEAAPVEVKKPTRKPRAKKVAK